MKTLASIQKTYNVFKTLAKIAMILSFIWAGTLLLGVLGGIVWQSGGNIVGVPVEYALKLTQTGAILQMIGVLLGDFVLVLTSNLPYTTEGGRYIFGDGTSEHGISAISGDVRIARGGK